MKVFFAIERNLHIGITWVTREELEGFLKEWEQDTLYQEDGSSVGEFIISTVYASEEEAQGVRAEFSGFVQLPYMPEE